MRYISSILFFLAHVDLRTVNTKYLREARKNLSLTFVPEILHYPDRSLPGTVTTSTVPQRYHLLEARRRLEFHGCQSVRARGRFTDDYGIFKRTEFTGTFKPRVVEARRAASVSRETYSVPRRTDHSTFSSPFPPSLRSSCTHVGSSPSVLISEDVAI